MRNPIVADWEKDPQYQALSANEKAMALSNLFKAQAGGEISGLDPVTRNTVESDFVRQNMPGEALPSPNVAFSPDDTTVDRANQLGEYFEKNALPEYHRLPEQQRRVVRNRFIEDNYGLLDAGAHARQRLGQSPKKEEEASGMFGALVSGTRRTLSGVQTAASVVTGDDENVHRLSKEAQAIPSTPQQQAFHEAVQGRIEEHGDESLWQGIKNIASATWEQPRGAMHEVAAQLPNSAVVMGSMFAGSKIGAKLGLIAGPKGSAIGAITGGIFGLIAGNVGIETGFIGQEQAAKGEYDRGDVLQKGVTKGGVISGIDVATMGLNVVMFKAAKNAVARTLTKAGVDPLDDAAVMAAIKAKPDLAVAVKKAGGEAALKYAPEGVRGAMIKTGAMGLEMTGEGAGEYLGTWAAGMDASFTEAVMEAMLSIPQSVGEVAISKAVAAGKHYMGKPEDAGKKQVLDAAGVGDDPNWQKAADILDTGKFPAPGTPKPVMGVTEPGKDGQPAPPGPGPEQLQAEKQFVIDRITELQSRLDNQNELLSKETPGSERYEKVLRSARINQEEIETLSTELMNLKGVVDAGTDAAQAPPSQQTPSGEGKAQWQPEAEDQLVSGEAVSAGLSPTEEDLAQLRGLEGDPFGVLQGGTRTAPSRTVPSGTVQKEKESTQQAIASSAGAIAANISGNIESQTPIGVGELNEAGEMVPVYKTLNREDAIEQVEYLILRNKKGKLKKENLLTPLVFRGIGTGEFTTLLTALEDGTIGDVLARIRDDLDVLPSGTVQKPKVAGQGLTTGATEEIAPAPTMPGVTTGEISGEKAPVSQQERRVPTVFKYPSGKYGYAGNVDGAVAYVKKDGQTPTDEEIAEIAQAQSPGMVMKDLGIVDRTFDTEQEAIDFAMSMGTKTQIPVKEQTPDALQQAKTQAQTKVTDQAQAVQTQEGENELTRKIDEQTGEFGQSWDAMDKKKRFTYLRKAGFSAPDGKITAEGHQLSEMPWAKIPTEKKIGISGKEPTPEIAQMVIDKSELGKRGKEQYSGGAPKKDTKLRDDYPPTDKRARLNNARNYLKSVNEVLEWEPAVISKKAKNGISINEGGPASGGEVTGIFFKPGSEYGIYISVLTNSAIDSAKKSKSGTIILIRATTKKDKYGGLGNNFVSYETTAEELARMAKSLVDSNEARAAVAQKKKGEARVDKDAVPAFERKDWMSTEDSVKARMLQKELENKGAGTIELGSERNVDFKIVQHDDGKQYGFQVVDQGKREEIFAEKGTGWTQNQAVVNAMETAERELRSAGQQTPAATTPAKVEFDSLYVDYEGVVKRGKISGEKVELENDEGLNFVVHKDQQNKGRWAVSNVEYGVTVSMYELSKEDAISAADSSILNRESIAEYLERKKLHFENLIKEQAEEAKPTAPDKAPGGRLQPVGISDKSKEPPPMPPDYGAGNKVFTKERAEKARELLRSKLNQVGAGVDPEILLAGIEIAGYHVEAGARSFVDFTKAMIADFGESIRPYLKTFYNAVRDYPDFNSENMDSYEAVDQHLAKEKAHGKEGSGLSDRGDTQGREPTETTGQERSATEKGGDTGTDKDVSTTQPAGGEELQSPGVPPGADTVAGQRTPGEDQRGGAGDRTDVVVPTPTVSDIGGNRSSVGGLNYILRGKPPITLTKGERNRINTQVKELLDRGGPFTEAEKDILRQYTGEGGLSSGTKEALNQHYTDYPTIQAIYKALEVAGFKPEKILEPAGGSGNFIGLYPHAEWTTIDIDETNHKVMQALYPDAKHYHQSFENFTSTGYDLVISNVPFLEMRGVEGKAVRSDIKNLHDFYFIHALDRVKDNGVVAFITSRGTMDKLDNKVRAEIVSKSDVIGAYRLPGGHFEKNSHTSVVTDIIFLQKRPEGMQALAEQKKVNDSFVNSSETSDGIVLNEFYHNRMENMLGEVSIGTDKARFGKPTYAITQPADLGRIEVLYAPYRKEPGKMPAPSPKTPKEEAEKKIDYSDVPRDSIAFGKWSADNGVYVKVLIGTGFEKENVIVDVYSGRVQIVDKVISFTDVRGEGRIYKDVTGPLAWKLASLQTIANDIAKFQSTGDNVVQQEAMDYIKDYKKSFETHPLKDKALKKLLKDVNEESYFAELSTLFGEDFSIPESLETRTRYTGSGKAEITKDSPLKVRAFANENAQGIIHIKKAKFLDTQDGIKLLDMGYSLLEYKGEGLVFQNDILYYSGNIYKKIESAKRMLDEAQGYGADELIPKLEEQIAKLEEIKPEPKAIDDINFKGNESWAMPILAKAGVHITRSIDKHGNEKFTVPSGQGLYSDLYSKWLNGSSLSSQGEYESAFFYYQRIKSLELQVLESISRIRDHIKRDPELVQEFEEAYNSRYRNYVKPQYDKAQYLIQDVLDEVAQNSPIKLRPNQIEWVIQAVYEGIGINAHDVGGGKTFAAIVLARVLKRRGVAQKPLFVVPAKTIYKWERDIKTLFPDAKIVNLGKLSKEKRTQALGALTNQNADYILVSIEGFGNIDLPRQDEARYVRQLVSENIDDPDASGREAGILEEKIAALEQSVLASERDERITLDKLGIDMIMADEAHAYKNIGIRPKLQRFGLGSSLVLKVASGNYKIFTVADNKFGIFHPVTGEQMNPSETYLTKGAAEEAARAMPSIPDKVTLGSARAYDFRFKAGFIAERNNYKNIFMLTATPTPNKPMEIYTMLRHLSPKVFDEYGINSDVDFSRAFFDLGISMDEASNKTKQVLRAIKNAQELRGVLNRFVDKRTMQDLNIEGVPEQAPRKHVLQPPLEYSTIAEDLKVRQKNLKRRSDWDPGDDLLISIYGSGRQAAIDPRLYRDGWAFNEANYEDGAIPEYIDYRTFDPASDKVEFVISSVAENLTAKPDGHQLIFLDKPGHRLAKEGSLPENIHAEIKKAIMERTGLKANEVAIISGQEITNPTTGKDVKSGDKDLRKQEIADAYNSGQIKVAIGTTDSMGEGMDLQVHTTDIWNIDIPYVPGAFRQRLGRGVRFGNLNKEVKVHYLLMAGTFDNMSLDLVLRKKGWNEAIWDKEVADVISTEEEMTAGSVPQREQIMVELETDPVKKATLMIQLKGRQLSADYNDALFSRHNSNNHLNNLVENVLPPLNKAIVKRKQDVEEVYAKRQEMKEDAFEKSLAHRQKLLSSAERQLEDTHLKIEKARRDLAAAEATVQLGNNRLDEFDNRFSAIVVKPGSSKGETVRVREIVVPPDFDVNAPQYLAGEPPQQTREEDIRFKRAQPEPTRQPLVRAAYLERSVNRLLKRFSGLRKKDVVVRQSESQLPVPLQEEIKKQGMSGGYNAMLWNGKIYLVADNLTGGDKVELAVVEGLLRHEGRHYAIEKIFGNAKARDSFFGQVAEKYPDQVNEYLRNNKLENTPANRIMAAEEVIIDLIRAGETGGIIDRFIARVAELLRQIFPNLKISNAEVRELIARADRFVEGAENVTGLGMSSNAYRASRTGKADPWYSQMERVLESKLPGTGSPQQIKQLVDSWQKKGEFKADELDWVGLNDWLDKREGKITKQEVLDFVRANNVEVQEVELEDSQQQKWKVYDNDPNNEPEYFSTEQEAKAAAELWKENTYDYWHSEFDSSVEEEWGPVETDDGGWDEDIVGYKVVIGHYGKEETGFASREDAEEAIGRIRDEFASDLANEIIVEDVSEYEEIEGGTKFSGYQMEGEKENYREVLLTMPEAENSIDTSAWNARPARSPEDTMWAVQDERGYGVGVALNVNNEADAIAQVADKVKQQKYRDKTNYRSSHWDTPNVLVHVRMNDRTGPNGEKILFLEEVQSDWHQEGRKGGYGTKWALLDDRRVVSEYGYFDSEEAAQKAMAQRNEEREALGLVLVTVVKSVEKGVPDAPFKGSKNWAMLAFKRLVRMAAEGGYDSISWTPGEVQADRYDLSKQVKKVTWNENKGLLAAERLDSAGARDDRPPIRYEGVTKDNLEDYIGKDAAEKLKASSPIGEWRFLEGDGLKVGATGMKGFYDKILPAEVNKFFNKKMWGGAKVGVVEFNGKLIPVMTFKTFIGMEGYELSDITGTDLETKMEEKYNKHLTDREYTKIKAWTLPITPEMRQKALREGMPKFLMGGPRLASEKGMADLETAKNMKGTPEEIWEKTGWWQLGDEWKFEISPENAHFDTNKLAGLLLDAIASIKKKRKLVLGKPLFEQAEGVKVVARAPLSDVFHYPALYDLFPMAQDVTLEIVLDGSYEASFDRSSNTLRLSIGNETLSEVLSWITKDEIPADKFRSFIEHEVQHLVQSFENFPRGGTVLGMASVDAFLPTRWAAKLQGAIQKAEARADKHFREKTPYGSWLENVEEAKEELRVIKALNAVNGYRLLTGEAEARMTQARLEMTPQQRKAEPPWVSLEKLLKKEGLLKEGQKLSDVLVNDYHSVELVNKYIAFTGTANIWAPEPGFPNGRPRLDMIGTGHGVTAYGHGWYSAQSRKIAEYYRQAGLTPEQKETNKGHVYKLDIPDASKPKMLKWDSTWSEQTPFVRDALTKAGVFDIARKYDEELAKGFKTVIRAKHFDPTGRTIYNALSSIQKGDEAGVKDKAAAEYLRSLGIVGNTYLDLSDESGQASFDYVLWDQDTIDKMVVLERNEKHLPVPPRDMPEMQRRAKNMWTRASSQYRAVPFWKRPFVQNLSEARKSIWHTTGWWQTENGKWLFTQPPTDTMRLDPKTLPWNRPVETIDDGGGTPFGDKNIRFSVKKDYKPEKVVAAYKLFRTLKKSPGQLFPLFIGKKKATPIGEWLEAEFIPTEGYAERPGWHAGVLPIAPHLRSGGRISKDRVWAEVEVPADKEWQSIADKSKTRDIRNMVPDQGHYKFKTNKMQGGAWIIGGAIKIKRILTDDEVAGILKDSGYSQADINAEMHRDAGVFGQFEKGTEADIRFSRKPGPVGEGGTVNPLDSISAMVLEHTESHTLPGNVALRLIESVTDRLRRSNSKVMSYLADKVDNYYDQVDKRMGWWNGKLKPHLGAVKRRDRKKFYRDYEDFWRNHDNGRTDEAQAVLAQAHPELAKMIDTVMDLFVETGNANQTIQQQKGRPDPVDYYFYHNGVYKQARAEQAFWRDDLNAELTEFSEEQQEAITGEAPQYWRAIGEGNDKLAGEILEKTPGLAKFIDRVKSKAGVKRVSGMMVFDSIRGGYRPIRTTPRGKFYPRMIQAEVGRVLRDTSYRMNKGKELWSQMVEALIEQGHIIDASEAHRYLSGYFSKEIADDYFAGVEKARQKKLPEMFYDYSTNGISMYAYKWANRLSQVEQFGQDMGKGAPDLFDEVTAGFSDNNTKTYVEQIATQVYHKRQYDTLLGAMDAANILATATQLGNPATATLNLLGGTVLNWQLLGSMNLLKAFKDLVFDWKGIQQRSVELGIGGKDLMNILNDTERQAANLFSEETSIKRALSKFANFTMTWGGYRGTENIIRTWGMVGAQYQLQDAIGAHKNNPTGTLAGKYRALMERNGIDYEKVMAEGGAGDETAKYLRKMVNIPQGSYRIDQTPLYVDTRVGRFLFKYQKFGTQVSRMFWMNYLKPFMDAKTGADRFNAFMGLMGFFAKGIAGGSLILATRAALFGYRDPGPDDDDIKKAFEKDDFHRGFGLVASRSFHNMMAASALGFFGNYVNFVLDVTDQQRPKNPFDPPALGTIKGMQDLVLTYLDQGTLTAGDLDNYLQAQLALYRGYKRAGTSISAEFNSDWKAARLFEVNQERGYVRKAARQFAKETGVEAKRQRSGMPVKSPMTPINRELYDALILGDDVTARAIVRKSLQGKNVKERRKVVLSMQASARARQPLSIQGRMTQKDRTGFYRWARENLAEENFNRVRELDKQYRTTMVRAGLTKKTGWIPPEI